MTNVVAAVLASARKEVRALARPAGTDVLLGLAGTAWLRSGLRYRIVVPDSVRHDPKAAAVIATIATEATVRTVREVPCEAVVVDGELALLPTEGPSAGLAVFRLPGIVSTVADLFERIWPYAVPFTAGGQLPAELGQREREVLALLSEGYTDTDAAARLDVGVRTVRRTVADLMDRLGARSRFQAGVKATDLGWLPTELEKP